jgi:hypothetical protein
MLSGQAPIRETLEGFARKEARQFIELVLDEEVEQFLGRRKSERGSAVGGIGGSCTLIEVIDADRGVLLVSRPIDEWGRFILGTDLFYRTVQSAQAISHSRKK